MARRTIFVFAATLGLCLAQQVGTSKTESHPSLTTYTCTSSSCTAQSRSVTVDANWRWLHNVGGSNNCYGGNSWVSSYCSDPATCLTNCAVDGADYSGTYGVTTSGTALTLKLVTKGTYSTNVGSRLFLMSSTESKYEMFKVLNKEFTFDVDVSNLPCGLNGALYFVEMSETGNMGEGNNAAGAKYGTGYCDGQCPHDVKFIKGAANLINWTGFSTNSGKGKYGACCGEMDIWEANKVSTAVTPHNCANEGLYVCSGATECGDGSSRYTGVCDKDGCDLNHYRSGNTDFYGTGKTVDTSKSFTVVTQFLTDDGTDTGNLVEIRRYYVQDGTVISTPYSSWSALSSYNSISDAMCSAQKTLFGDTNDFKTKGGMTAHGKMLARGMVLVLSLWDDWDAYMLWLDSNYPTSGSSSTPGVARGSCATSSGVPTAVESSYPDASVTFSNIKVGSFGSTASGIPVPSASSTATPATTDSSATGTTTVSSSPDVVVVSSSPSPDTPTVDSTTTAQSSATATVASVGIAALALAVMA